METEGEYMQMLQTTLASEVDKFFNRNCSADTTTATATATSDVELEPRTVQCPVSIAEEVIHEVKNVAVVICTNIVLIYLC